MGGGRGGWEIFPPAIYRERQTAPPHSTFKRILFTTFASACQTKFVKPNLPGRVYYVTPLSEPEGEGGQLCFGSISKLA